MRIAVFSDIHGNFDALKRVMSLAEKERADKIVFLGDIFQRKNQEVECLEYLKNSGIICVKGNCELYLDCGVQIDRDVENLRGYYDNMREKLTAEQRLFIHNLPLFYEIAENGRRIMFSHFLFKDKTAEYPYFQLSEMETGGFLSAVNSEEIRGYDLVAVGHAHKKFVVENVVGVSAAGIGEPSVLMIEIDEKVSFQYVK